VLVRIDANVPVKDGVIGNDFRLRAVVPTVEFLSGRGAIVILLSHLGRPKGRAVASLSLAPVAKRLSQITGKMITFVADLGRAPTELALAAAVPGQVFMLENLRFDRGEESNSGSLAKRLAGLGEAYVNDAFGVSHRAHASVAAITRYLPSYAGFLMERELRILGHVRDNPAPFSVALVGGAKIGNKLKLIRTLAKKYDRVLLGGGLANAAFAARGFGLGSSLLEPDAAKTAAPLLKMKNLVWPCDVLVGNAKKPSLPARVVPVAGAKPFVICRSRDAVVDIGPRTILDFAKYLKRARTIVWNGPMGIAEIPRFAHGTVALARIVAARSQGRALGVVGGGETVEALEKTGMSQWVDHISTGGGAMLEFLEGLVLPGVKPLYGRNKTKK
jgi:phosphoglycerate kinase